MRANGDRRVVVTGLGAVTPLAGDVASSWERLLDGRSAAGPISAFDASALLQSRRLIDAIRNLAAKCRRLCRRYSE